MIQEKSGHCAGASHERPPKLSWKTGQCISNIRLEDPGPASASRHAMETPMNRSGFDALVQKALGRIPGVFCEAMKNLETIVEDWPDPELMREVTGDPEEVLYGLFTGTPLPDRHFDDAVQYPDLIYLYRGPLEEDFSNPEELAQEIEITLAHEIGHYLGFDEAALAEYGYE
jgi:predicted Zn-dependent protease with MMP-like domain